MALPTAGAGGAPPSPSLHEEGTPTPCKPIPAAMEKSSVDANPVKTVNPRASFSSIREDGQDLAQSFTTSKISAYARQLEQAFDNSPRPDLGTTVAQAGFFPPITQPSSRLHGSWDAIDNSKGWKGIDVKGRRASRSFSDLASLSMAWQPHSIGSTQEQHPSENPAGESPFEKLPLEIQGLIFGHLVIDIPPNSLTKRNIDLMSLMTTSKTLNAATQVTLYRQITVPHSRIFRKFLTQVASRPQLGELVRRLDFCHFNPNIMFATASERSLTLNLTADTLLEALDFTPYLQEFLAQEHIDADMDDKVLRKLFFGLDRIAALDFCGCSSAAFRTAFTSAIPSGAAWTMGDLGLKRLSLHKCTTLPGAVFENLLSHLPLLTHLDVAGTRMTDAALAAIPHSARLTHLNLAKCTNLSAGAIMQFLATHPAVASRHDSTLVWLSLSADASTHETFDEEAVTQLLPLLPRTLKSLSLKGSKMNASHIPLLLPLTKHLEELALGRGLSITDTNALFTPDEPDVDEPDVDEPDVDEPDVDEPDVDKPDVDDRMDTDTDDGYANADPMPWVPHTLRFLDLSDLWSTEVDLPTLYDTSQCALLNVATAPLEVLEVHADVGKRARPASLARLGWHRSEAGRRVWFVRDSSNSHTEDNDIRGDSSSDSHPRPDWKMGADNWGTRKVAVARADVGGMYGSYMFGRKL